MRREKGGRTQLYLVGLGRLYREGDFGTTLMGGKDWGEGGGESSRKKGHLGTISTSRCQRTFHGAVMTGAWGLGKM